MSDVIPMHQAKSTLSQLVQRAAAGETVLIGPNGEPRAKLVALSAHRADIPARRLGSMKGRLRVPKDFDEPLGGAVLVDFEGASR